MLACPMQRIIPEGVEAPTAFETVGHIAHLNLKPEQLAYKHAIGQVRTHCPACPAIAAAEPAAMSAISPPQLLQVLIDKNPSIRTVVNKVRLSLPWVADKTAPERPEQTRPDHRPCAAAGHH